MDIRWLAYPLLQHKECASNRLMPTHPRPFSPTLCSDVQHPPSPPHPRPYPLINLSNSCLLSSSCLILLHQIHNPLPPTHLDLCLLGRLLLLYQSLAHIPSHPHPPFLPPSILNLNSRTLTPSLPTASPSSTPSLPKISSSSSLNCSFKSASSILILYASSPSA